MSKTMQNLVVFMEPSKDDCDVSLKGGNKILNRFCIDEDAAFELSGVSYLKKSSMKMMHSKSLKFKVKRKVKGKDSSFFEYLRICTSEKHHVSVVW